MVDGTNAPSQQPGISSSDGDGGLSRSQMMQRRMDMPLGTNPAAKVVRRSTKPLVQPTTNTPSLSTSTQEARASSRTTVGLSSPNQEALESQNPSLSVVGAIVERPRRKKRQNRTNDNTKVMESRPTKLENGFPSLQVPIGTYLTKPQTSASLASQSRPATTTTTESEDQPSTSMSNLCKESAKEADALLSQMSQAEIEESKRELEQMLTPDMVAFLRGRKHQDEGKRTSKTPIETSPTQDNAPEQRPGDQFTSSSEQKSMPNIGSYHEPSQQVRTEEELRMFQQLASIQTHEDLDAAYQAEHDGEKSPFFVETSIDNEQNPGVDNLCKSTKVGEKAKQDFRLACDLLRSAVPRQNLWAVRTVQAVLQHDMESPQRVRETRIHPERSSSHPYPITLPVSLRCLLDVQASHRANNGYVLHAHVLQALYLLLRLRVVEDQDVNVMVGNSTDGTDDTTVINDTSHSKYQQWFAQDAAPCTPVDLTYQKSKNHTVQSISVNGHENVAYASTSSSESAVRDGQNFWRDPLWTLLSQMRIIPQLAQLVEKSASSPSMEPTETMLQLPKEGIAAMCGILAMMAQRSPGAAAAIAEYQNLTSNLLTMALSQEEETNQETSWLDHSVLTPVVMFLSVLARQSYVAAKSLQSHTEDLITRVFSLPKATNGNVIYIQQWTLVLWRTLLRYGLGRELMETVLTVTASQRARTNGKWPCDAHLFSCLQVLIQNTPHQTPIRWATVSVEKSCIQQLEEASKTLPADTQNASDIRTLASCLGLLRAMGEHERLRGTEDSSDFNGHVFSEDETSRIRCAMLSMWESGLITHAFKIVLKDWFLPIAHSTETLHDVRLEAAMASFVCSFLSILSTEGWIGAVDSTLVQTELTEIVLAEVKRVPSFSDADSEDVCIFSVARRGWRNVAHVSVMETVFSKVIKAGHASLGTAILTALIGRLQFGEEALAHLLLQLAPSVPTFSTLSSMFTQNLRSSSQRVAQVNRSLELFGYVSVSGKNDPLISLSSSSTRSVDMLLPVGRYWLWKVLAGTTETRTQNTSLSRDFLSVVQSACRCIQELEQAAVDGHCCFSAQLNQGGKLYYVMNLCLQDEEILGHNEITDTADKLVATYGERLDRRATASFMHECMSHSSTSTGQAQKEETESLTPDEETAKSWMSPKEKGHGVPKEVMNFVNDLCSSYVKYGAQYGALYTRCMRTFLLPAFAVNLRCEVLRRLDGLLHLFTIEDDDEQLYQALCCFVRVQAKDEGVDPMDKAVVGNDEMDDPEWLDALARVFPKGSGEARSDMKFIRGLAVYCLGRSLVQARQRNSPHAWTTCKVRLQGTEPSFGLMCVHLAIGIVNGSNIDSQTLIVDALQARIDTVKDDTMINDLEDGSWTKLYELLA